MKRRLVFTEEQGRTVFPLLPAAFRAGESVLCSQHPRNDGKEKRQGTPSEIVRGGRAINRIIKAASQEREFTDDELLSLTTQFSAQHRRAPLEEETAKWPKPIELKPGAELIFSQSEYERLKTYCDAAEWGPGADMVADLLDIIDAADKVDG